MKNENDTIQQSAVEDHDGILTIRGGGQKRHWNGIHYKQGMSAKNVGSTKLSVNIATIPPGGIAYAHIHDGFELMLYILEGKVRHEFGDGCNKILENEAGDFSGSCRSAPYRRADQIPDSALTAAQNAATASVRSLTRCAPVLSLKQNEIRS